ncbi:MAG: hypothetical protein H0W63_03930 [Gemmatimonadaceae bacterium]|nr:hypothetical protein [Gemmatimonadaceae bacterium]
MTIQKRAPIERKTETISQYFDFERMPEKAELKVKRGELYAVLTQFHRASVQMRWPNRLWRYLKKPLGSGPIPATEGPKGAPTEGDS